MQNNPSSRNPWAFVPTLYFAEGLPYILINTVSVILYKRMGIDNVQIAFWTSWLYLPWVIKMFWGPSVDVYSTKRNWILYTSLAMALAMSAAAFSLGTSNFFAVSLAAFAVGAFISATYDIATDGFYMLALSKEQQALFVGIRTTFYRLAMIFGTGPLVIFAGSLEQRLGNVPKSWMIVLASTAAIFALFLFYHKFTLPYPPADEGVRSRKSGDDRGRFGDVVRSYFQQDRVLVIIAFILLYRLGEAMLLKLVSPFLLDTREAGGLALTTTQVGVVYGTVGIIALILGGITGGWLIAKFGLKRCIWPMALLLNLPDLFYVYMAAVQPGIQFVYPLIALEQFGYGLGFTAFTVYIMYAAHGRFKTSHFAISTGIMAIGMMFPGMVSGAIQKAIGSQAFFMLVFVLTIPGMLVIPFLPTNRMENKA
jgi:PAT family beta-lactamase induction signal transducer AmpG